mmetsp:Transcript_30454/g.70221  ORF Transcript_30454/g.70221 Transcript_30454/m.70221 type:complete len:320 (-) Transcript_30454:1280-2239(-)
MGNLERRSVDTLLLLHPALAHRLSLLSLVFLIFLLFLLILFVFGVLFSGLVVPVLGLLTLLTLVELSQHSADRRSHLAPLRLCQLAISISVKLGENLLEFRSGGGDIRVLRNVLECTIDQLCLAQRRVRIRIVLNELDELACIINLGIMFCFLLLLLLLLWFLALLDLNCLLERHLSGIDDEHAVAVETEGHVHARFGSVRVLGNSRGNTRDVVRANEGRCVGRKLLLGLVILDVEHKVLVTLEGHLTLGGQFVTTLEQLDVPNLGRTARSRLVLSFFLLLVRGLIVRLNALVDGTLDINADTERSDVMHSELLELERR